MNNKQKMEAALIRDDVLSHFLRCDGSVLAFLELLKSPDGKRHATTLIGALLIASATIPNMGGQESDQAVADIDLLCRALASQHARPNKTFDA